MIEKRRRDRINNSLLELRRLVPAAFEKQGSAKLEKAEILQMTVDHLRTLHSKGNYRQNPNISLSFHIIYFLVNLFFYSLCVRIQIQFTQTFLVKFCTAFVLRYAVQWCPYNDTLSGQAISCYKNFIVNFENL